MTLYLQLLFVSGGFLLQMQPEDVHCDGSLVIMARSICPGCTAAYKAYCATLISPMI